MAGLGLADRDHRKVGAYLRLNFLVQIEREKQATAEARTKAPLGSSKGDHWFMTFNVLTVFAITFLSGDFERFFKRLHLSGMKEIKCAALPETTLETYLAETLPAQIAGAIFDLSVETIEDHLLVCPTCQHFAETHELLMFALKEIHGAARSDVMALAA